MGLWYSIFCLCEFYGTLEVDLGPLGVKFVPQGVDFVPLRVDFRFWE